MSSELVIKVSGDTKDLIGKLDGIKAKTKELTTHLDSVAVKSGLAFAGFSALIGATIKEYAAQEQAQLRTEAVIKSTGQAAGVTAKQVFELADAFQETTTNLWHRRCQR